jgi:ABC-type amino acid transport substrate-binding protein
MKKTVPFKLLIFLLCLATAGFARESARSTVRVGIFPSEPLSFIDDNGEAKGLNCDLLREITKINTLCKAMGKPLLTRRRAYA